MLEPIESRSHSGNSILKQTWDPNLLLHQTAALKERTGLTIEAKIQAL
jgi:hypothetical protein